MSGGFADDALAAMCRCVPNIRTAPNMIGNGGAAGTISLTSFRPNPAVAQTNGRGS